MRTIKIVAMATSSVIAAALAVAGPAAAGQAHPGGSEPPSRNGLIVFQSDVSGRNQLYTLGPDGTELTQITRQDSGEAGTPDWSPDGRRIVFEIGTDNGADVAVVKADGSHLRILPGLHPEGGAAGQPSYSPDGREIFYEQWDGGVRDAVFRVRVDGGAPKQVTYPTDGYFDTDPNVAPDGRQLSFVRVGDGDRGEAALFTINLRTGQETQLTPYSFNVAVKHAWSPNGRRLAITRDFYHAMPGTSGNVVTFAADGSDLRNVTTFTGGDVHGVLGSYSPDGRWIVYREQGPDRSPLMIARPDGSAAHPILDVPGMTPRHIDWGTNTK